ncbi:MULTISPECIES: hypothetical protein [unclassified Halomonas]|uniref:hypothetical protein n=1 Tax=unclassified Halomonas TaxID=2609666 RepID=UPI002469520A|nr:MULTISPECIES: hypothetical protein [unclassified Halomonas]
MFSNECFALMGSMSWMGWLMPLTITLLLGLGIASLIKYLVSSNHSHREDRS